MYIINFVLINFLNFFFENAHYFVVHLIKFQITSKHIDDSINHFLTTIKDFFSFHIMHIASH
jgi:hypothetical protein